jgi:hypothetical protein
MKSSILNTIIMLSLSAGIGPVHLMAQAPINFTIPFDFNMGSKSFTAGEYRVRQPQPGVIAITSVKGRAQMALVAHRGEPCDKPGFAKLTFHRYGDYYFLSQVADNNSGWVLAKSSVEKEMIARRAELKPVSVVASNAK